MQKHPQLLDAYTSLLEFYIRNKEAEETKALIEVIVKRFPDEQSIARLKNILNMKE